MKSDMTLEESARLHRNMMKEFESRTPKKSKRKYPVWMTPMGYSIVDTINSDVDNKTKLTHGQT